jgi:hypothetical protein
MENNGKGEGFRKWVTTGAEIIAIGAVIFGFYKFYQDKQDISAQLAQTTSLSIATNKLAIASDSQLIEFRKQNDLFANQNKILEATKIIDENRFKESTMPDFVPSFYEESDNINDLVNQGVSRSIGFINRGNQALIDSIHITKSNTYKIEVQTNGYVDNGEYFNIFLEETNQKHNMLDFYIYMKDKREKKYKQWIHTDKNGKFIYKKPVPIN